jgi:hypothetical protein
MDVPATDATLTALALAKERLRALGEEWEAEHAQARARSGPAIPKAAAAVGVAGFLGALFTAVRGRKKSPSAAMMLGRFLLPIVVSQVARRFAHVNRGAA